MVSIIWFESFPWSLSEPKQFFHAVEEARATDMLVEKVRATVLSQMRWGWWSEPSSAAHTHANLVPMGNNDVHLLVSWRHHDWCLHQSSIIIQLTSSWLMFASIKYHHSTDVIRSDVLVHLGNCWSYWLLLSADVTAVSAAAFLTVTAGTAAAATAVINAAFWWLWWL